jgi:hypothetical protein
VGDVVCPVPRETRPQPLAEQEEQCGAECAGTGRGEPVTQADRACEQGAPKGEDRA